MRVGLKSGFTVDALRRSWDGTAVRPLRWTAWYPADEGSIAQVPLDTSWFRREAVAANAPASGANASFPLVLLSHGTGATAVAVEWLGFRLAQKGYIALAIDHHGNTGSEPYRAEGFLCMWERAADFKAILDQSSWRRELGIEINDQIYAAGFSAGAYTALLLAGARIAFSQFEPDNPQKSPIRGPREFPNLADELPNLYENPVFRASWDRRRADFSEPRVRAALGIAPGRSVLGFSQDSLQDIGIPVHLIGGDEDMIAPPAQCCRWLSEHIPLCKSEVLSRGVGHYTFLPEGSETGRTTAPELFADAEGLSRTAIHDIVARRAAEIFASA
ncbi:MAG TPA: alpha/beta fold hydrolase [Rhizobium sp.]|nr:alpha/beta fold hydrolase [Rhizobium sp.]